MKYYDKLIFELSRKGRVGYTLPQREWKASCTGIPSELSRSDAPQLPELSELDVVRHYTNLSQMNFGVDTGFYPLGSCTMKYNPKINEEISSLSSFAGLHPLQDKSTAAGAVEVETLLRKYLSEITGMADFTLNPFAGAHGELTGLMIMRKYHIDRGDSARTKVIVPDSAHGTNPASAAVCGLQVIQVKSRPDGRIDVADLEGLLDETVAGIMMTNPNTLGLFEREIPLIAEKVHACGGLLYYDGANMNPMIGVARPGDMGFDIMHLNLHKSFSTPHGGGGPGSGPVGVAAHLVKHLPASPVDTDACTEPACAGSVGAYHGNFGVYIKALAYILMLGRENVKMVGPLSVLNANYIKESLKDCYELPIEGVCKHEFVFDGLKDKSTGVTTLDVAKRLLDYGFHAPTIYFPLLFHQAIMIEPTESESRETIDSFIEVMKNIASEAASEPDTVRSAPLSAPVKRLDETTAAREPKLKYFN